MHNTASSGLWPRSHQPASYFCIWNKPPASINPPNYTRPGPCDATGTKLITLFFSCYICSNLHWLPFSHPLMRMSVSYPIKKYPVIRVPPSYYYYHLRPTLSIDCWFMSAVQRHDHTHLFPKGLRPIIGRIDFSNAPLFAVFLLWVCGQRERPAAAVCLCCWSKLKPQTFEI